jgi:hypothetical protein
MERPVQRGLTAPGVAAALGVTAVILVGVAWGTGLVYLAARLGLGAPLALAWMDGVHVYVGAAAAVVVAGKLLRFWRARRAGPPAVAWERWVAWSLLPLYGAVVVSGALALVARGSLAGQLVNLHQLASVWALVPTTWHLWHGRRRAVRVLLRPPAARHVWLGCAVAVTPALLVLSQPRAASELPQVMGGAAWSPAGLAGVRLTRLAVSRDGRTLVAAGDGVYAGRDGGAWRPVDFVPGARAATEFLPGGHGHGPAHAAPTAVQSLAAGGGAIYVGTASGLYAGAGAALRDAGLPGQNVEAIAVDPSDPRVLWTASTAGVLRSADGGSTWTEAGVGLTEPEEVTALASAGGQVFASDTTGVFAWSAASGSWSRTSDQASVIGLTASPDGRRLYAASAGGEVRERADGTWRTLAPPALVHAHTGSDHAADHAGLQAVLPYAGRLFAVGVPFGVMGSPDGGRTWVQLGNLAGAVPGQVVAFRGDLWAATLDGLYRLPLTRGAPASAGWWLGVLGTAMVAGLAAPAVASRRRP